MVARLAPTGPSFRRPGRLARRTPAPPKHALRTDAVRVRARHPVGHQFKMRLKTLHDLHPGVVPKGGRSADVMRADDWNLIEHDESDRVRPFNLAHALGQTRNPRTREPGQVDQLCIWLGPGATREDPQTNAPYPDFDPAASAAVWGPGPVLLGSAHRQSQRAGAGLGVAPGDGHGCGSRTRRAMSAEQTGWFRGTPLRPAITWPALPPARKGIPLRRARCAARPVSGRHRPDRARADRRNSPGWRCVPRSRGSRGC